MASQNHKHYIFTKGAPEVMLDICLPESLPTNFEELLHHYTHSGFRVIACAYKQVSSADIDRETAESDLAFAGFIILKTTKRRVLKVLLKL